TVLGWSLEEDAGEPTAGELLDAGDIDVPIVQPLIDLRHVLRQEHAVGADRVAGQRSFAHQRNEPLDVLERLRFGLSERDAVRYLFDQPRSLVHLGDEIAHVRERGVARLDDDLEAGVERLQLEIGDDHGDLDEFVDSEIQSRHLTVDPDEAVILRGRYHALILLRAWTWPFLVPQARFERATGDLEDRCSSAELLGVAL